MLAARQIPLILVLGTLGAGAWWWVDTQPQETHPARPSERRPDYVVEHLRATRMDTAGQVHHYLDANELRHYPDDGSSELDHPTMTLFTRQGTPWLVSAYAGWVSRDGELVRLRGNVVVDREASALNRPVRLETEALQVKPRDDYAETDLAVRVTSGADWVESTGLRAWLGEAFRIELAGRVHALLQPEDETPE